MSKLEFPYFAVVQIGYCIHGVGKTHAEAEADAQQYFPSDDEPEDEPEDEYQPASVKPKFDYLLDGSVGCVPCTKALFDDMEEWGERAQWRINSDGVYLNGEIDEDEDGEEK